MPDYNTGRQVFEGLYQVIKTRKEKHLDESYTCKLFARGKDEICKKFGEEAVEVIIAALNQKREHVINESADTIFHLLVLWAELEIEPGEIMDELNDRFGTSGIEEKRKRSNQKIIEE